MYPRGQSLRDRDRRWTHGNSGAGGHLPQDRILIRHRPAQRVYLRLQQRVILAKLGQLGVQVHQRLAGGQVGGGGRHGGTARHERTSPEAERQQEAASP